jgi:hypothetical protein
VHVQVNPKRLGIRMFLIFAQIFLLLDSGMKTAIQILLLMLFTALTAVGCGGNKNRLPRHGMKFARVYADLARMRERIPLSNTAYPDSARVLLKKVNYTPEDFQKSCDYFNETPERWALFYREVQKILQANKSSAAARR